MALNIIMFPAMSIMLSLIPWLSTLHTIAKGVIAKGVGGKLFVSKQAHLCHLKKGKERDSNNFTKY